MKHKNIIATLILLSFLPGMAKEVGVSFHITNPSQKETPKAYVSSITDNNSEKTTQLTLSGNRFTGNIEENPYGLYTLFCNDGVSQLSFPFYVKPGKDKADFDITFESSLVKAKKADKTNAALFSLQNGITVNAREMGNNFTNPDPESMKQSVISIYTLGDSIASLKDIPADVADYARVSSFIAANDTWEMCRHIAGMKKIELGFSVDELLPRPDMVLNCEIASFFPATGRIASGGIRNREYSARMAEADSLYTVQDVKAMVFGNITGRFLDRHDYKGKYAEGEKTLTEATAKYFLSGKYLEKYRERKATVTGNPFPNVTLKDAEGNKVPFSNFAGKYVYVDLWASWCGPCVREIPYLKKLEKVVDSSKVVFVSISTDSDVQAWKRAMEKHAVEGIQLIDASGNLCDKLNVAGIPHFLLYDPEGNLHTFNAPKPSSVESRELLNSL